MWERDCQVGKSLAPDSNRHGTRRKVERGDGMEKKQKESDYVEQERERTCQPIYKPLQLCSSLPHPPHKTDKEEYGVRDTKARQFPQNKSKMTPLSRPPVC